MPNKPATTKKLTGVKVPHKPRPVKKKAPVHHKAVAHPIHPVVAKRAAIKHEAKEAKVEKPPAAKARYIFATGRRKTAVANVRLFEGKGENSVNKKPLEKYFNYRFYLEEVGRPFDLTGLAKHYYFTAQILGGGMHSQAGALKHGLATALGTISPEIRKVLKKNGLLTRDDRKKERKKPGLKRARRAPQWAKR